MEITTPGIKDGKHFGVRYLGCNFVYSGEWIAFPFHCFVRSTWIYANSDLLTTNIIELTQSVGCTTLARCPSFSIYLGRSAAGCPRGPCITGIAVGSILMERVSGIAPDALCRSRCWSGSSFGLVSARFWCTRWAKLSAWHTLPDNIGFCLLSMTKKFTFNPPSSNRTGTVT